MSLADATALWKSVSPQKPLQRRNDLLAAADSLQAAAPVFVFARDLEHAHAHACELERVPDLNRARAIGRDLARGLDPARAHAHVLARDLARGLGLDLDYDHARVPADDFIAAHDNLIDAATNFLGADLDTADLVEINLAGIRWDSATQWPTTEWAARIRRASVEDPPGSGVFVVLPEDHDITNLSPLAPIS